MPPRFTCGFSPAPHGLLFGGRGVAVVAPLPSPRHYRSRLHIHRMLGLVGQMSSPILHLGDASIAVVRIHPLLVTPFLLPLAVHSRQIFPCGCLDPPPLAPPFPQLPDPPPLLRPPLP